MRKEREDMDTQLQISILKKKKTIKNSNYHIQSKFVPSNFNNN